MNVFPDILICPVCGAPLRRADGCLRCAVGHVYDLSRFGYANLLPPGKGRNAKTGDERDMIRARASFLRKGFYDPMDEEAADLLARYAPDGSPLCLIDMGAGEGTHTCKIAGMLRDRTGRGIAALGFDASKHGAESGCRYARSLGFLPAASPWIGEEAISASDDPGQTPPEPEGGAEVLAAVLPANLFRLPVRGGSADMTLSLFAPIGWDEIRRILKPCGIFLAVSAGREHLLELRQILYDDVRFTDHRPDPPDGSGFTELERRTVSFPVKLDSREEIGDLFMMTPFYHRVPQAGRERLAAAESLTVTAQIAFSLFRRNAAEE